MTRPKTRINIARRSLHALPLAILAACSPAVELPQDDASTADPGGSTDASTTGGPGSASTTSPTLPPDPPPTSTDPYDLTTGGFETTDSDTQGGCTFLGCDFDLGDGVECSVFEQDCPEGEKCSPWANDGGNAWNATRCVPVARDPAAAGEPCTAEGSGVSGIDSCERGSMCWNLDSNLEGTCYAHCTGSPQAPVCEDATQACLIGGDDVLTLCYPRCNPLTQDECAPGQACYPLYESLHCAPDASGEGGAPLSECEFINACDPGTACVDPALSEACSPDAAGCCLPWCDLSAPACPGEMVCMPWFEEGEPPPGSETVGLCVDASALG